MKTKIKNIIYLFGIGCFFALLAVGCRKDEEPEPEVVPTPAEEALYFITGRVESNGTALANAQVEAEGLPAVKTGSDGTYLIGATAKNKTYALTFSAKDYVSAKGQVTLPETMEGHSAVMLSANLGKANAAINVAAGSAATISNPGDRSSVKIPAGATTADAKISVTTASPIVNGRAVSMEIVCSPAGLKFEKPVTLTVGNLISSGNVAFVNPKISIETSNATKADLFTWKELGIMAFDAATNTYTTQISEFGLFTIVPEYTTSTKPISTNDVNTQLEISNCGNAAALRNQSFTVNQKTGWEFPVDPEITIGRQIPEMSASDRTEVANLLHSIARKYVGTTEGVYTLSHTETVDVSGNSILIYTNKPKITAGTLTLPVLYKGTKYNLVVTANMYMGADITFQSVSCDTHSGGAGN